MAGRRKKAAPKTPTGRGVQRGGRRPQVTVVVVTSVGVATTANMLTMALAGHVPRPVVFSRVLRRFNEAMAEGGLPTMSMSALQSGFLVAMTYTVVEPV